MPGKKKQITENVQRAKHEIAEAEADLDNVIRAIGALPRAQKVTISEVVSAAFEKLTSAHGRLAELEKLLKDL